MNTTPSASDAAPRYRGDNKLILGIVLAVVTFWLFAQTTLNVAPAMRDDLRITEGVNNIAVSITALFSGIFIVIAGGFADKVGRVKLTNIGVVLGIIGSLLIVLSPVGTATFLMIGRMIQGLSAACIMPSTLALMKAYFQRLTPCVWIHKLLMHHYSRHYNSEASTGRVEFGPSAAGRRVTGTIAHGEIILAGSHSRHP
jgi:MFS family permease